LIKLSKKVGFALCTNFPGLLNLTCVYFSWQRPKQTEDALPITRYVELFLLKLIIFHQITNKEKTK